MPTGEFARVLDQIVEYPRDQYPIRPLVLADADATVSLPAEMEDQSAGWAGSAHARSGGELLGLSPAEVCGRQPGALE